MLVCLVSTLTVFDLSSDETKLRLQIGAVALILVAAALSFPRRRPPRDGKSKRDESPARASRHHCECYCSACEAAGTGAFAMRDVDGDYSRFRGVIASKAGER